MKKVLPVAMLVAMLMFASPALAQTGGATTQAPDLRSVGNFREGPPDDGGNPQTLVDYTFDQAAYLRGGNRSSFNLVPLDGGDEVPARGIAPPDDTEGDQTVTVLFEGEIGPSDYARGFVDTGVVTSRAQGPNTENPLNINQSANLSRSGQTQNPDLASVTYDGGDIVLFEFDQALTAEDVVQNNSGLRVYFPEASQASRIREAGATNVTRESPTTLRAQFGDDLPGGRTLDQAVGAFVQQGAVQAAPGEGGANRGANAFDEAPLRQSGDTVCSPSEGSAGDGAGPTEAPDLQSVGNFRRGPATAQGGRTTCVDFTFDQIAYLVGGNRTSLNLIPQDGGDAISAGDIIPQNDQSGDNIVTGVFPGDLGPSDFPRGFVSSNVVTSRQQGANPDNPYNINQAEPISNNGITENPDLVSATFDGGDQVVYEFDEPLTTDDVVQNNSGLRVYFPDTDTSAIRDAGAANVTRESPTELRAFFPNDLPGGKSLEEAAGAFVDQGSVQAAPGSQGDNAGSNAFDELAPLQDSGRDVCTAPEGVGGTGDGAGPTEGPDLQSVGNFRRGPATAQGTLTTCVDFTFDQAAYLRGGNQTSFHLVPQDGGDALDGGDTVPQSDQEGDNIVTAVFPGQLDPQNFPRGFVDSNVATSREAGPNPDNPLNVNQAEPISNNGITENPDLVSATFDGGDQVVYEFDEPLTTDDVVQNNSGLRVYFPDTDTSAIRDAGAANVTRESPTELRAFFPDDLPGGKSLQDAAGAFVAQGAVQAAPGSQGGNDGSNAFDELAPLEDSGRNVCAASDDAGGTGDGAGPTEAPDLQSVGNFRRGPATAQGTLTTCVDFTFDQASYLVGSNRTSFSLIPQNGGDALSAEDIIPQRDEDGDNIVTVVFPGQLDPQNFPRGFVDTGVVGSREQGANTENPLNINQAEPISNNGITENPDLVSATFDGGDQILYEFDEPLTDDDIIQNTSGLRVYFPEAESANRIREAGAQTVVRESPTTLRAFFADDLPGGRNLEDAVGAFVDQGSVQAAPGSQGGNAGSNAFDELTPLQDSGAQVCPAPDGIGGEGDSAGPTEAPDLQSVGNFRRGPATSQGTPSTCVDFTFDQIAYLNGGDKSNFQLVPQNGGDAISGSTNVATQGDEPGDNIVTVVFPGNLSPDNFARGYVDSSVVNSEDGNVSEENPYNINQSEDINPNKDTQNPDLVRVIRNSDSFTFEFDEPLTNDDLVQNNSGLNIYFADTTRASTIRSKGAIRVEEVSNTKLRAFFGEDLPEGKELTDAVGGFVQQGSVQAVPGSQGGNDGKNAFDETLISDMLRCTVIGTSEGETLTGTPGRDVICGLGGDDTLRGFDGNDELRGGSGDDTLSGGSGTDRLFGQNGEDRLFGNEDNDILRGGADQDRLVGGKGDDNLAGGTELDRIFGQGGDDRIYGQQGDDVLRGGSDDDRLVGADGEDNIVGASGEDVLFGGDNRDVMRGGDGDDSLYGGNGNDNIIGGDGRDRFFGQNDRDYLNSRDGVRGELVNGGNDRDRCVADQGDNVRNCP